MNGRRAMVLWSGVVLLASAPVSLLLAGESMWPWAAGKAVAGTIMILSALICEATANGRPASGRLRRAVLPATIASASLALVMASGLADGGESFLIHYPGQVKLSPGLAALLERAGGGLRVSALLVPSDGRHGYLHALFREISMRKEGFEYEFVNPARRPELARRLGMQRAAACLVLEKGGKSEVVELGQDPQYALALGLSRLLGRREPPVLGASLPAAAVFVISDGAFLLLGSTCLDAIPLVLVLVALWRRQVSRRQMATPGSGRPKGEGIEG